MKAIAFNATVIYSINGFQQKPPRYFNGHGDYSVYEEDSVGDIITPFLQNYKYKIKSIFNNFNVFSIDLEPFCDNAKKVFDRQYGGKANAK